MKDRPIFILSQARSGSTFVQRVLNQTENVLIQGELCGFADILSEFFSLVTANTTSEHRWKVWPGFCKGDEAENEVIASAEKRLRDMGDFSATVCSMSRARLLRVYRDLFLELFNPTKRDVRWGFKEIRCCTKTTSVIRLILEMFPEAKFVLTVRHPLDQLNSKFAMNWWPSETWNGAISLWSRQAANFKRAVQEHPESCRIFKYEDFTVKPGLDSLLSWVGVEPSEPHYQAAFGVGKVGEAPVKLNFSISQVAEVVKGGWKDHQDMYPCSQDDPR